MIPKTEKCNDCQYYSIFFKYCYQYSDDIEIFNTDIEKECKDYKNRDEYYKSVRNK